ncbi:hypothetical protein APX83_22650 [Escherichia coli]|nr:hypothetical protein [Escherichia coli]KIH18232.1 hypothetical protein PU13_24430 [Escherichia coli]PAZ33372.1 hypothetical protein APU35_24160 [Escherichia coli]PAZ41885.1 hypothetical protein APU36_04120 [Escherichia coli]PAZ54303.1 hypothetical protein APX83_22650 [Escherichia coli]
MGPFHGAEDIMVFCDKQAMAHNAMPGKVKAPRQGAALRAGPEITERLNTCVFSWKEITQ